MVVFNQFLLILESDEYEVAFNFFPHYLFICLFIFFLDLFKAPLFVGVVFQLTFLPAFLTEHISALKIT